MSGDQGMSGDKAECEHALEQVYTFLDNELDPTTAAVIRQHIAACEPCLDHFDLELMVKTLVRRSCGGDVAPADLRSRVIMSMTTSTTFSTGLRREL